MKVKRLEEVTDLESLYPQEYVIPLVEVLSTGQNVTSFISQFIHGGIYHIPKRPEEKLLFAAIL